VLPDGATFAEVANHYDADAVNVERKADDSKTQEPRACAPTEVSQLYYPSCNAFHERDLGRVRDAPEDVPRPRQELLQRRVDRGRRAVDLAGEIFTRVGTGTV